jgi:hypothetical protein
MLHKSSYLLRDAQTRGLKQVLQELVKPKMGWLGREGLVDQHYSIVDREEIKVSVR